MRQLMISAIYALAWIASCALSVYIHMAKLTSGNADKNFESEKVIQHNNTDNASQSLTTYYPGPTGTTKIYDD